MLKYLFVILPFISCGPQPVAENSSNLVDEPYIAKQAEIYVGDITILEADAQSVTTLDGKGLFLEDVSSGYLFSLSNNPSQLSVDSATGVLSYTMNNVTAGLYTDITLKANQIANPTQVFTAIFSIAVNGDPLRKHAWHIDNTGQTSFAARAAQAGFDMNLDEVFKMGITGKGVRIAVSDTGAEVNHDDLVNNQLVGEHRDYSLFAPYIADPTPVNGHGTAVTGIISAEGWNNLGSLGVAPNSKFAHFQFLDSSQTVDVLIHQASGDFRVFNYSYGDAIFQDTQSEADYLDFLKYSTITDNKIYVKAAGNEHYTYVNDNGELVALCYPHNANMPFENESPYMLLVGALAPSSTNSNNPSLIKASYSNAGSNLWISAPGGEYGKYDPAIITTDLPTCLKGFSKAVSGLVNDFEYDHPLNPYCNYTSSMNGTSSAAPMVVGVVALMLEANPNLKMRDVKYILAHTSAHDSINTAPNVNPDHADNIFGTSHPSNEIVACSTIAPALNLAGHNYELGWVKNAAGYWFNNFYGFGQVNAEAAVIMAKNYSSYMAPLQIINEGFLDSNYASTVNATIPDDDATGLSNSISVNDNITVESVQVKINVSHGQAGQVGVELTSPGGTKSILLNINNSLLERDTNGDGVADGDSDLNVVLTSNAFYGESSTGIWTVKVIDGMGGTTGTFLNWKISILGHN